MSDAEQIEIISYKTLNKFQIDRQPDIMVEIKLSSLKILNIAIDSCNIASFHYPQHPDLMSSGK
jgi:hypothetical protein